MTNVILSPLLSVYFPNTKETVRLRAVDSPQYSHSRQESDAGILLKRTIKATFLSADVDKIRNSTQKVIVSAFSNRAVRYHVGEYPYLASISLSGGIPHVTITFEALEPVL
ncbi:MAG: hypothetical protein RR346_04910 [Bacteroidales bacterium]